MVLIHAKVAGVHVLCDMMVHSIHNIWHIRRLPLAVWYSATKVHFSVAPFPRGFLLWWQRAWEYSPPAHSSEMEDGERVVRSFNGHPHRRYRGHRKIFCVVSPSI